MRWLTGANAPDATLAGRKTLKRCEILHDRRGFFAKEPRLTHILWWKAQRKEKGKLWF